MADTSELKPPFALPFLSRDDNGQVVTVYIDALTGTPISDLKGYTVLTQSQAQAVLPEFIKKTDSSDIPEDITEPTRTEKALTDDPHTNEMDTSGGTPNQNINDNFGYISKPGLAGIALGTLGGPLGKLANVGWNVNNKTAVDTARTALGLANPTGKAALKSDIKGALKGDKGQISRAATINNKDYHIGFEALSPDKKTNLTVAEAQKRANLLGGITEDPDKVAAATRAEKKNSQGIVGGAITKLTGLEPGFMSRTLNKVFGIDDDTSNTKTSKATSNNQAVGLTAPNNPMGTTTPSGVNVGFNMGVNRPDAPLGAITNAIANSVANTLGTGYSVSITSGQQTPAQKAQIDRGRAAISKARAGKALSAQEKIDAAFASKKENTAHRHPTGLAADFAIFDPTGKQVTDKAKLADFMSDMAFSNPEVGLGFGQNYMGSNIHADLTGLYGGNTWGGGIDNSQIDGRKTADGDDTNNSFAQALGMSIDAARRGFQPTPFSNPGVPTARPDPSAVKSFVSQDERSIDKSLDPLSTASVLDSSAPKENFAQKAIADTLSGTPSMLSFDSSQRVTSPAAFAALGLIDRTPEQKALMSRAIAGELGPTTLKALSTDDPTAKNEFANMVATMDNRAASKMYSSLEAALTPSQYNSLSASNAKVTDKNFNMFANVISKNLNDYYSGALKAPNPDATSYYNPSLVDPSWGSKMSNPTQVGLHMFGSLGEYGPSKTAQAAMDAHNASIGTSRTASALGGSTPMGLGGIGSDRGSASRASSSNSGTSRTSAALGAGGIGSDRGSASRASSSASGSSRSSSSSSSSSFGGGIGSDRGSASRASSSSSGKGKSEKSSGPGGIGHA